MAVRFLPAPHERTHAQREEREDLAEVIEFRARVKRPEPEAPLDASVTEQETGPTAYQTAVKLLARRALSSGELHRALCEAGYEAIQAEEAVAECEASLYLDDVGLASSVTQKLRESKGASQAVIRRKLRERLFADAAIEAALAELDADDELALLTQTARDRARRLEGLDRQTAERRLLGFLARRGWSGEKATRAAREALDSLGGEKRSGVRFR